MARKPRLHYPGAFYHVIQRGNAREDIFFSDTDRNRFLLLVQENMSRFGFRIHAFCLMTNHLHLVLQVGEIPLSRFMQNISFRFTRWSNWRRNRSGHLFQGRYKAVLVDADAYLVQLIAYLHLNPVRAGMVTDPVDYPWSSHRAYLGKEEIPWLTTEPTLSQFSARRETARRQFAAFVRGIAPEGRKDELRGGGLGDNRFLGGDAFIETVLRQAEARPPVRPGLESVKRAVADTYGVAIEELAAPGQGTLISQIRAVAAWAVHELSSASLTDLGKSIGRDVTSLSSAIRRLRQRAENNRVLAEKMERVRRLAEKYATLQA
jgi:putative transposase